MNSSDSQNSKSKKSSAESLNVMSHERQIVFIFIAGGSEAHVRNMRSQREACFTNLPSSVRCLWLVADVSRSTIELEDSILFVPIKDVYSNLLLKTVMGIRWVLENWDIDFIIRSNTSNYFNLALIERQFLGLDRNELFYGGATGVFVLQDERNLEYKLNYVSGSGIYLSRAAGELLTSIDVQKYRDVVEDIAIGDFFRNFGITPYVLPRNDVSDWDPLRYQFQIRLKAWHSNALTLKRFERISKIFKASSMHFYFLYFQFEILEVFSGVRQRQVKKTFCLASKLFRSSRDFSRLKQNLQ
jgi:hypothetical protein